MLEGMIGRIEEPNRTACRQLLEDHEEIIARAPGSGANHQAWPGGYMDHLEELAGIADDLYATLSARRPLPFTLPDAMLVLFLHDIEKPFKYVAGRHFADEREKRRFRSDLMTQYCIALTPDQENALTYVHGEGEGYSSSRRIQGPLAAFVHCCDTISARIWHDEPKRSSL